MTRFLIPARGGSKRLKRKNLLDFFGVPLIGKMIMHLRVLFNDAAIYVSTDDLEIADVAREFGACLIERPSELSDDYVGVLPVIKHAIKKIGCADDDEIIVVYPFSLLLSVAHIASARKRLEGRQNCLCVSVCETRTPLEKALVLSQDDGLRPLSSERFHGRTQDMSKTYFDSALFYLGNAKLWLNINTILGGNHCLAVEISELECQDVDTLTDYLLLKAKYTFKNENWV